MLMMIEEYHNDIACTLLTMLKASDAAGLLTPVSFNDNQNIH